MRGAEAIAPQWHATTWVTGVIGDGRHGTIAPGEPFGSGRYAVPLDDWTHLFRDGGGEGLIGEGEALVFTVPPGLPLRRGSAPRSAWWCDAPAPGCSRSVARVSGLP